MSQIQRFSALSIGAVAIAALAACASPNYGSSYPQNPTQGYPAQAPGYGQQPVYGQFGTVSNVELMRGQGAGQGVVGAVAGGVVGGALGNQVGGGTGRTAATVAGVVGGALIGHAIERNMAGNTHSADYYRVTVQIDGGGARTFDYAQAPNVRIGERVRVDGNQLYR